MESSDRLSSCTSSFPDGSAPAFGDGDDARGLWCRADCPADYRGLLALGAVLFRRGDFKTVAGRLTEEVLWLLGPAGVDAFDRSLSASQRRRLSPFPMRATTSCGTGGTRPRRCWCSIADPLGFGPAGHGHADALSFQLHADGYPFFVDSGTFLSNLDYGWRDAFSQYPRAQHRRRRWRGSVGAGGIECRGRPWRHRVRGPGTRRRGSIWWTASTTAKSPCGSVAHRRVVMFLKPGVWIVWDELGAAGRHALELLFTSGRTARPTRPLGDEVCCPDRSRGTTPENLGFRESPRSRTSK